MSGRPKEVDLAKKSDGTAVPKPIEIRLGEAEPDTLRAIGGSKSDRFNTLLIDTVVKTRWFPPGQSDEDHARQLFATATALQAFKPADEIEAMLAAQALAMHHASMECGRLAMIPGQPFEVASKLRKDAANMARAMTDMLDALDRKRGKGAQVVRVERVVVHEGGQAIVGNVGGDTPAATAAPKPAAPQAISHDRSGLTLDGLIGEQPELVGREGV
jgi:hypothetical protein